MKAQSRPSVRNKAMDLLARREHSEQELRQKLKTREYESDEIEEALQRLIEDGLLSDGRFAESYVNHRVNAGLGPMKIRFELRQKGISDEMAETCLSAFSGQWDSLMRETRERKFGVSLPDDYKDRMKQARFLQNRGFSPESVMRLFR